MRQLDLAVQQLSLIRQSLIQMYITKGSEDGIEVLATQIQGLKLEASSSKSVSRSTSTLSSKRPPSSSSSRASFKANLRETAKLLSFPPLPQIWTCEFSVEEICTSILIVQNQVLTCLYGLTEPPIERSSRTSTSMSTASRVRSGTPSVKGQEDISKVSVILEALESQAGGPLAIFRQAAEHMQPTERSKIEHYIATIYSLIMKRTSELAVNENASPLAIIKLQFYAIECLLENQSYFAPPAASAGSMDTDDKSVTSLAGNLYRALTSFGKMSTANNIPETELASQISQKVFPLVSRIGEVIKPEERLTFSKAYLELMDLLVQLFDKGKIDIAPLQRHLRLSSSISSGQLTTIETPPLTDATTDTVTEREALRFCTTLTTQVASLEQWISSGYASVQVDHLAMQDSLKYAAKILQLNVESPANVAMVKIRRTVVRSLERMHHYAYRAYKDLHKENDGDSNPRADISDVTTILKGLLSAFCVTVEVIKSISELQARAVDTLLLFARIEFRLDEPASYKPVHQYIQRCFTLLNIADSATSQDPRLLGTLASSAYSVGRALYNAEKYANAIPFLSNSCASTDAMVDVCKQADSSISLIELLDKSANRWELLGSAYMQCQEKEDAVRAYLSCLRALYQRGGGCDVAKPSLDPTFMRVLTKYTRLCILDLFMSPETASIAGVLSELSPSQMSDVAKARMLEAQSNCLHDYLHKSEAVSATNCWLDAAIAAYETCGTTSDLARYVTVKIPKLTAN